MEPFHVYENKYFVINGDQVSLVADKQQGAAAFLSRLRATLQSGDIVILPPDRTLKEIVEKVVAGYEKKQGIFHRIWECFLSVFAYFVPSRGTNLSVSQKIHHYASEIASTDCSKVVLLSTDDPSFSFKEILIEKMPQNRRMDIVNATPEELIQLALNVIEGGYKPSYAYTPENENQVKDNSFFDKLVKLCSEEGKIPTLISALKAAKASTAFYLAAAKECVKNKDLQKLMEVQKQLPLEMLPLECLEEAIDLLLEKALQDGLAYRNARAIALPHILNVEGFEALMKIFNHIMKHASVEYEVAIAILEDIRFSDKIQFQERICQAIDQLTRVLVQKKMFQLAEKALKLPLHSFRCVSPLKELALYVYDEAMKNKKYSLAIAAAHFPIYYDTSISIDRKQQCQSARGRLQEIAKLLPDTGDEREDVDHAIKYAGELIDQFG